MGRVFTFALTAALNPTLLTAVTVMLTLSRPKRLLAGYLAGATVTSLICGLLLVFSLDGSSAANTAKNTIDPILDLVLGGPILLTAFMVGTGRDQRRRARSARKREEAKTKPPPRWRRKLSKGSARDTFLVGVLLSFPGASYIAGMSQLSKQNLPTATTVTAVIAFNMIMLLLLEFPLLGYAIRPDATAAAIERFKGDSYRLRGCGGVARRGRSRCNAAGPHHRDHPRQAPTRDPRLP